MRTIRMSFGLWVLVAGLLSPFSLRAEPASVLDRPVMDPANTGVADDVEAPFTGPARYAPAVDPDEGCTVIGENGRIRDNTVLRYRANVLEMTEDGEILEIGLLTDFSATRQLYYSVHEKCPADAVFTRIVQDKVTPCSPPAQGEPPFYCWSGVFDPPVALQTGCEYAVGVSWGNQTVDYYQYLESDHPDGPQIPLLYEEAGYWVNGSLGRIFPTEADGPPVADQHNLTISDNSAYTLQICLGPKPGACCLSGNTCVDLVRTDCEGLGGDFTAPRFLCREVRAQCLCCPCVDGACCQPGGGCADVDYFSCQENNGLWHPDALCTADPTLDPCLPRGACCLQTGACTEQTAAGCAAVGGVYQGDDTECVDFEEACGVGACCFEGACFLLTEAACAERVGIWQQPGTDCAAPNPCAPPGACCLPGSTCADGADRMTQADCVAAGGTWQGDWTTCDTIPAQCGRGACCVPSIGCVSDVRQTTCEGTLQGEFLGDGSNCALDGTACVGACCWLACDDATPLICEEVLGVFTGYAPLCPGDPEEDPDPCADPLSQEACCLVDGTCIVTEAGGGLCASLGGTVAVGRPLTCEDDPCSPPVSGACCIDGQCAYTTDVECAAEGGTFAPGIQCRRALCAMGACCLDDGNCAEGAPITAERCADVYDGNFYLDGSCAECPVSGACCLQGEPGQPPVCTEDRTRGACLADGGHYYGDGVACADVECDSWACCLENGTCTNLSEVDCAFFGGEFHFANLCGDMLCPGAGACCVAVNDCRILTADACVVLGGAYAGTGTECGARACALSACCGANCTCQNTYPFACAAPATYDEDFDCTDTDCPPCGSCCYRNVAGNVVCAPRTEQGCAALDGGYGGDGTVCDADTCVTGACCVEEESCVLSLQGVCDVLGGSFLEGETCTAGTCGGACCLPDGTCRFAAFATDCPDGSFNPTFNCSDDVCPVVGACCPNNPANACFIASEQSCRFVGDFVPGRTCSADLCDRGGCCHLTPILDCETGSIRGLCEAEVDARFSLGDDTCAGCEQRGACCPADGSACVDLEDEANCIGEGSYFSIGRACFEDACLVAACCLTDGSCAELTALECDRRSGSYYAGSATCDLRCSASGDTCTEDADCWQCSDSGDPCEVDADCNEATQEECIRTETCTAAQMCSQAACCSVDDECQLSTSTACTGAGYRFLDNLFWCPTEQDPCEYGACCRTDGSCTLEWRVDCESAAIGGAFQGDDTACPFDNHCHACCAPGQPCADAVAGACAGAYYELNTCQDRPCAGACCLPDGSCATGLDETGCLAERGWFYEGRTCTSPDVPCSDPGFAGFAACCIDGRCRIMTEEDCLAAGGHYAADVTSCLEIPGLCTLGTCCAPDGTCSELQVSGQCEDPVDPDDGYVFSPRETCWFSGCVPRGACCSEWACHSNLTPQQCEDVGGVYLGDDTDCVGNQCELGACCRADGTCVDRLVAVQCAAIGGSFVARRGCCEVGSTCAVKRACCIGGACIVMEETECDAASGIYHGEDTSCIPDPCLEIISSDPSCGSIDARQPHPPAAVSPLQGWDTFILTFDGLGDLTELRASNFKLEETGGDGIVPAIVDVSAAVGNTVVLELEEPIEPGTWTTITYMPSDTETCVGFLPGDVSQNRVSDPADLTLLIACINGNLPICTEWKTDTNRSGQTTGQDILREIDLLNGGGSYGIWSGEMLPAVPCLCN